MLAAYLTWHLRQALAPLTYTDENPPDRDNPVEPARRSTTAATKAARKTTTDTHLATHSYQGLLTHLGTLTRNQVRFAGTDTPVPILAKATDTQRRAFQLLDAAIPPDPPVARTTHPENHEPPAQLRVRSPSTP